MSSRTKEELGFAGVHGEELAAVPIRGPDGIMTLYEAASWLYDAHQESDPDEQKAVMLAVELARLRREAERVEDVELVGATDALETSAREIWATES